MERSQKRYPDLRRFFGDPFLSDCIVTCGASVHAPYQRLCPDRRILDHAMPMELPAHCDILASRSMYMRSLLEHGKRVYPEALLCYRSNHGRSAVHCHVSQESAFLLIKFLYTGRFSLRLCPEDAHFRHKLRLVLTIIVPELTQLGRLLDLTSFVHFLEHEYSPTPSLKRCPLFRQQRWASVPPLQSPFDRVSLCHSGSAVATTSRVLLVAHAAFFEAQYRSVWAPTGHTIDVYAEASPSLVSMTSYVLSGIYEPCHDVDECLSLMQTASYLDMALLQSDCIRQLTTTFMTPSSVCTLWNASCQHSALYRLQPLCLEFFETNFVPCTQHPRFHTLHPNLLKQALDSGRIAADSGYMIVAIKDWAEAVAPSSAAARDLFQRMMPPSTLFNTQNRRMLLHGQSLLQCLVY